MSSRTATIPEPSSSASMSPTPIIALDVPSAGAALDLVRALPDAAFFKVGLQLYIASGPDIVRELRELGNRVFLDLKLHDIPNTVAGAVRSAAALEVDLLTVHASGGADMLQAAAAAARDSSNSLRLLGVTVLTSLGSRELAHAWGRAAANPADEAVRLARMAGEAGLHGVVTSIHEVGDIRARAGHRLALLCPGIRFPGDAPGDQNRVGTPEDAARLGVDYVVIGRAVTAAPDPPAAFARVLDGLSTASAPGGA